MRGVKQRFHNELMYLIDSHSHFDDDSFDADRSAALARARAAGVVAQVVPAVNARLWPRLREVCGAYPGLYPAYGLHPICLADHDRADLDQLAAWIEQERPVAVGEIGLDYYIEELDRDAQREYFLAQLGIARDARLPVVVHARHAVEDTYQLLRRFPTVRGVVHSFAGSEQQARRLIDLGYCLGFGGPVTYARANRLRTLVQRLPLESILLETDSPDQPGARHRGERNEPARITEVLREVARLRDEDPAHVAAATYANTVRLFDLGVASQ